MPRARRRQAVTRLAKPKREEEATLVVNVASPVDSRPHPWVEFAVSVAISLFALVVAAWAAFAAADQSDTMRAQTALLEAQTEVMSAQSSFEESAAIAASLSAQIERSQAVPLVALDYSVEATQTEAGESWIDVLTITNAGGPMLDVTMECHTFWEVGFGPSRADAELALLPAVWPWFEIWEPTPILERSKRIEGHLQLVSGLDADQESDRWYQGDSNETLFYRPWAWLKLEYTDVLGDSHVEWYQVSGWGTIEVEEEEAMRVIHTLAPLSESGLSVGDYLETVDSVYAKVAEAWDTYGSEMSAAWQLF